MGTIIEAKDFERKPQIIDNAQSHVGSAKSELEQYQQFISDIKDLVGIFKQAIGIKQQQVQQNSEFTNQPVQAPPTYGSAVQQTTPQPQIQKVTVAKKLDPEKVILHVRELMTIHADKLPWSIKNMKLKEIIGDNWQSFKYKNILLGREMTSAEIEKTIAEKITEFAETCYKEEA